jgi:hypothetical protein
MTEPNCTDCDQSQSLQPSVLSRQERIICSRINRRRFIGATFAGTLGALAGREPQLVRAAQQRSQGTADAIVVLWMAGGMAQTETFDPKRYVPFESGLRPEKVLSTFPAIDTAVDHIKFTEGLERIARVIDRGAVIARDDVPCARHSAGHGIRGREAACVRDEGWERQTCNRVVCLKPVAS